MNGHFSLMTVMMGLLLIVPAAALEGTATCGEDAACLRTQYEEAADRGDIVGQINLALLLLEEEDRTSTERAVNLLERVAGTGDSWSAAILAGLYTRGDKIAADGEKAVALLQPLADDGNIGALAGLGDVYAHGAGSVAADPVLALELYQAAASLGDLGAKYKLGFMLVRGEGTATDPARGLALLEEVANTGNDPWTLINIGELYSDGRALPVDAGKTVGYYQRAVEAGGGGGAAALVRLGMLYQSGLGDLAADPKAAAGYFERAVEAGDNAARVNLALMLLDGSAIPANAERAVELLQLAADGKDVWATTILAGLYTEGKVVPADGAQAVALLQPLADGGNGAALSGLGDVYARGAAPIERDPAKARALYEAAAAADDLGGRNKLGLMLVDGVGGPADVPRGLRLLRSVAAAGDPWAMIQTGDVLAKGAGVPLDAPGAVAYYRRAADAGIGMGLVKLGGVYRDGLGSIAADPVQAVRHFEAAAGKGDNAARVSLALMLLDGSKVAPDVERALELLNQAAGEKDGWATATLAGLYADGRKISPDYEEARRLSLASRELGDQGAMVRLGMTLVMGPLADGHAEEGVAMVRDAVDEGVAGASVELARLQAWGKARGDDARDAESALLPEVEAGNADALRVLLQIYRDGATGMPARRKAARELLDRHGLMLAPPARSFETMALLAYQPTDAPMLAAIGSQFEQLAPQDVNQSLQMLFWANKNAYVYVLQQYLRAEGLYDGPLSGLLTRRTITAIREACVQEASAELCRRGPLTPEVAVHMAGYVADRG